MHVEYTAAQALPPASCRLILSIMMPLGREHQAIFLSQVTSLQSLIEMARFRNAENTIFNAMLTDEGGSVMTKSSCRVIDFETLMKLSSGTDGSVEKHLLLYRRGQVTSRVQMRYSVSTWALREGGWGTGFQPESLKEGSAFLWR